MLPRALAWPTGMRFTTLCGALLAIVLAACQDPPAAASCGEIPGAGCPTDHGGTCSDPTCSALYSCASGAWTLQQMCSGGQGGQGGQGGAGRDAGVDGQGGDAGPCPVVKFDLSGEVDGCSDLQNPDCPAAAAQGGCVADACLTGCADFYVCRSTGWTELAYCDDQGQLTPFK